MAKIDSEEAFLEGLSAERLDFEGLLNFARDCAASEAERDRACALLDLLADACEERGLVKEALRALQAMADYSPGLCEADLEPRVRRILGGGSWARQQMAAAGWGSGQPLGETLSKLVKLLDFRPGVMCLDVSWGIGKVVGVDVLHGEAVVDFAKHPQHRMALSYALGRLVLLAGDHLLYRLASDRGQFGPRDEYRPELIVKSLILSCGPLTEGQIKDYLVPAILPEGEWDGFWQRAREQLRKDPELVVPRGAAEPWQLREEAGDLRKRVERCAPEDLPKLLSELRKSSGDDELNRLRSIVEEKIRDFVQNVAVDSQSRLQLLLEINEVMPGMHLKLTDVVDYERAFNASGLKVLLRRAGGRSARWFLADIVELIRDGKLSLPVEELLEAASSSASLLAAAIEALGRSGYEEQVRIYMVGCLSSADCPASVILWVSKNVDRAAGWGITPATVLRQGLNRIASHVNSLPASARRRLSAALRSDNVVEWLVRQTPQEELEDLVNLIQSSMAWDNQERGELLGKIIRRRPEMQRAVASAAAPVSSRAVTSWRSYRERHRQLEQISSRDIPKAAAEIARAREYGDLRENYEYKAAKEHQAMLWRRKQELEESLSRVTPTDFSDIKPECVAPGLEVEVEYDDGRRQTITILGVWDHDEELNIISCDAPLARAVMGHRVGEEVVLPESMEKRRLRICAIRQPGEDVRRWIMGGGEGCNGESV